MTNYYFMPHNFLKQANELYTDYYNNFTTMRAFADYHGLTLEVATTLIAFGKSINHDKDLMATLYPLNNTNN